MMSKKVCCVVTMIALLAPMALAIDAHWQPLADPNRPAGTPVLWTIAQNWSTTVVPNAADQVVWMATGTNKTPALIESGETIQINQLKLGEGSDQSNNGHLIVKGVLDTNRTGNWQGIGAWGNQVATLEIDGGVFNTYAGGHLWAGNQGHATIIIKNGGELHVGIPVGNDQGAQLGLGWDGTTGWGHLLIQDGIVTVNNWNPSSVNINTPSYIDICRGTLSILGYRITNLSLNPAHNESSDINYMATQGRITGYRDAKFDKKVSIDNPGSGYENDVINNVRIEWIGGRTVVTAVHPQQPAPDINEELTVGDIELAWNNWDPNNPGESVFVDVWFGTDPNKASGNYTKLAAATALDVTGQARSSVAINVPTPGHYYWQVDTTNGANSFHEGDVFEFTAVTYKAPIVSAPSVVTTMALLPATLTATVTNNNFPITSASYTLLEDFETPEGANAVLTNTTTNNQAPSATFTTDKEGTYKAKLVVTDGTTTIEKIVEIEIYADACAAKKASPGGWAANYYDRDSDCDVDITDFAALAREWLDDTSMKAQETQLRDVSYMPKSIFNARIEAESAINVSDAPVTDETGVRIVNEGGATGGGKALGWTGNGTWAEFQVTISEVGSYDVYYSVCTPQTTTVLNFGDGTTADLYGSVGPLTSFGGWGNYGWDVDAAALEFTAAGTYTIRIGWTNEANLDWFTLVKSE